MPRIKPLPAPGDAARYLVDGELIIVSGCWLASSGKHPLELLGLLLKQRNS